MVSVHREQVEGVDERDLHDIGLRLDGEKECAWQKRLDVSVPRAAAFGKDDQRHAVAQAPQRRLDGADGSGRVLLVDADLSRAPQMPTNEWVGEQFTFENDAELEWQVDVENRNVERRGMRDRVNPGLGIVERVLLHACNFHRRQDRLQDEPRPEAGEIVLDATAAIEERGEQRERAQNDRVEPDQRGKDEVGAQAAEPAMAGWADECVRPYVAGEAFGAWFRSLFFRLLDCSDSVQDSLSKITGQSPVTTHTCLDANTEISHRFSYDVN